MHQLMRIDKQAKGEEHYYLHKPCEATEECGDGAFKHYSFITYYKAGDIDRQIGVATGKIGEPTRELVPNKPL